MATLVGWGIWIAYATNPPSESAAMLQYMSKYVGGIYNGTSPTPQGVVLAVGIMAVFKVLAPVSFVIASLILYWATWQELRIALPVLLVGAVVYGWQQIRGGVGRADISVGLWLVYYLVAILVMSAVGSFGGTGTIKAPWDHARAPADAL